MSFEKRKEYLEALGYTVTVRHHPHTEGRIFITRQDDPDFIGFIDVLYPDTFENALRKLSEDI